MTKPWERVFRCECGSLSHALVLSSDGTEFAEMIVTDEWRWYALQDGLSLTVWWDRIKAAAAILWRGHLHQAEIVLKVDVLRDIATELHQRATPSVGEATLFTQITRTATNQTGVVLSLPGTAA